MRKIASANHVSSGVKSLDEILGGGFPPGSLIILAGNPGTGKTIFATQFCCQGCRTYGEPSIYVSFAESRAALERNIQNILGLSCERCPFRDEECKILDFTMVKGDEGIATVLETVVDEVMSIGARRLVIELLYGYGSSSKREGRRPNNPSHGSRQNC